MNERNVVDVLADVGEDLRDQFSTLPVALEFERARHERTGIALPHVDVAVHFAVERLAGVFVSAGL